MGRQRAGGEEEDGDCDIQRPQVAPFMASDASLMRLKRTLLPTCLLLLIAERQRHGYEIVGQLRQLGYDWDGRPGPTYNELRKLEREGLLASEVQLAARGPARRVYRLTRSGAAVLNESSLEIAQLMELLQELTARRAALVTAGPPPRVPSSPKRRRTGR